MFKYIFAKEIKVMKLKINKASQIIIQELIESYPSENKYIQWVAKRLGCFVSDLRLLESIHQEDEEGDNLVSFFPDELMLQNEDWKKHLIHSDDDIVIFKSKNFHSVTLLLVMYMRWNYLVKRL